MANTDVYVNKITLPKDRSNTYTGILVDTASQKPWFGTSATSASTQTKSVTCSGFYLQTGVIISVAFNNANTYTSAKLILNVNSTGAKDVYYNNAVTSSSNTLLWDAGEQVTFMYNGTGYYFVTKSKVVSPVPQLNWYGTCSTASGTATKSVTCDGYTLNKGNIIGVLFTTASTDSIPTLNVNSTGNKSIYIGYSDASDINPLKWSAYTMIYFMYDGTNYKYITAVARAGVNQPRGANTWYGTCSTDPSTSPKIVTCPNFVLTKGATISISNSSNNIYTSGALQLNVNSTGAIDVYYKGSKTSSTNTLPWNLYDVMTFIYTGGYYEFVSRSANTAPLTIRTWS